jgi:hypothetical protein
MPHPPPETFIIFITFSTFIIFNTFNVNATRPHADPGTPASAASSRGPIARGEMAATHVGLFLTRVDRGLGGDDAGPSLLQFLREGLRYGQVIAPARLAPRDLAHLQRRFRLHLRCGDTGSRIVMRVPSPSRRSAVMVPPCAATFVRAIE